jgi:uncharacterized repeat protein (TIGR01451 family)
MNLLQRLSLITLTLCVAIEITVTVSGGGETNTSNDTATDVTTIGNPTGGLVAAYAFDEGSGTTVTDLSGNGNTGALANTTWTSSGKYGGALAFDGSTSRVTIADAASLRLTTGMTLEAWVNPAVVTDAWRDLIYKGNDNYFLMATTNGGAPGGGGIFGGADVPVMGTGALPINTWTHLAVTYDGAQLTLYVNGVQVANVAQTGAIATSGNPLQLGSDSIFGQAFQGLMDEVRVYNVALPAAQIQQDMNTPLGASSAPDLTVTKTHSGTFSPGQTGATYTITVTNSGSAATSGTVTATDTLPSALTATAFAGTGWSCTLAPLTCTRSDALAASSSYPALTLTVNVASSAPASVTNTVTVSGGGETNTSNDTATDVTTIGNPTSGLVAAYSFNEGSGTTVADLSGNGNTGFVENATWTTAGKYGNALLFNGANAWVRIPDSEPLHLTTAETLEAWVDPLAIQPLWMDVIHKDRDRYYIEASSNMNGEPEAGGIFTDGKNIVFGPSALPVNTWTHLALTYDSAIIKFYINGALVASSPETGSITISTNPLFIGGDQSQGQYFNGIIDEIRVYNRALTVAEIQSDMSTPLAASSGSAPVLSNAVDATGAELSIRPRSAVVTSLQAQQFTSTGAGVAWSVDGIVGGSPQSGTITSTGLYSPPAAQGAHTVGVAASDQSRWATAAVYVSNYAGSVTHHNDYARTGQNLNETVLTPSNVAASGFGKIRSYALDGVAHASPLYVAGVNVPGRGIRNVVFVATEHDSVYAFDADGAGDPLWQVSFINPAARVTTVPSRDTGECCAPEVGITGTPVIDPATGTLYVVAKTKENGAYVQRLHALSIATGAEKFDGPVKIRASVAGTGAGAANGLILFDPLRENQRAALLLVNGVVYIGFGSHGDTQPSHGWVLGYAANTLRQVVAFCTTPNGKGGGIWQANGGLAADSAGNIFFVTGDGTFDASTGGVDFGDSLVKMSATGAILDYFTPHDQANLDINNFDLGAAGPLLLPDQSGPHPHLVVSAGKNGTMYLVDRDNMGHFNANNDDQIVQSIANAFPFGSPRPGNYSSPVFFNGSVYFSPVDDNLRAFHISNGLLSIATSRSAEVYAYPGGSLAVSANGSSDGVLWAVQGNGALNRAVLRAYDASDVGKELYNNEQAGPRDILDEAASFSVPLVANGKVFVASMHALTVFGLLP